MAGMEAGKVKTIFLDALECSGPDREAFLLRACNGDDQLRAEVEAYLSAEDHVGEFLSQSDENNLGLDMLVSPVREKPGAVIGRYKLLELIGEGGFGSVFMAEQQSPVRRNVALKIIKQGMDTRQGIARFEAERQALAMLDHPNIAKVLDAGETETGRPFFVMELVRGLPVTQYCDQNNLATEDRLRLFVTICHAMQHAHQKGIIHRDIKPGNVLVTLHDGQPVPRLIDFGIAKATQSRLTDKTLFTEFHQLIGTPAYMSPEQAELSGLGVDIRTDIYSLGALLYELLTGTTPFNSQELRSASQAEMQRIIREVDPPRPSTRLSSTGKTADSIAAHSNTDPRKLSLLMRGELDWIVMKAMEKDRTRRYESAGAFARDIVRHLEDQPVEACPPGGAYLIGKFLRRHRKGALTAVAAIFLLLMSVLIYVQSIRIEQRKTDAALIQAQHATARALSAEAEANRQLVESVVSRAQAARASLLPGRRFDSLAALSAAVRISPTVEVRSQAAGCMALADVHTQSQWRGPGDANCFSHDCKWYADTDPVNGDVLICRVPSIGGVDDDVQQIPIARLRGSSEGLAVAFSRDNRLVAVTGRGPAGWHVAVYAVTGEFKFDLPGGPAFDFTPDSNGVAVANPGGPVLIYDLHSGRLIREATLQAGTSIAFSPDGKQLATWTESKLPDQVVNLCDLTTGHVLSLRGSAGVTKVVWHPDGTRLAAGNSDHKVYQWDVSRADDARPLATLVGHNAAVTDLAYNRGGDLIVSCSPSDHSIRLWDVDSGSTLLRFGGSGRVQFNSDGNLLAVTINAHDNREVMQVASGRERRTFVPPAGYNGRSISFSSDSSMMACGGNNLVRIWNLTDPSCWVPVDVPFENDVAREMAFSPDGSGLVVRTEKGIWKISFQRQNSQIAGPAVIHINPNATEIYPLPYTHGGDLKLSRDGQWAAVAHYGNLPVIVNLVDSARSLVLKSASPETIFVAISPDQKWVATGKWKGRSGPSVSIWDAKTGDLAGDVPVTYTANVGFSPDGNWLTTCTSVEYRFVNVGTWNTAFTRRMNVDYVSNICFSSDSKILAVSPETWGVQLTDVKTGKLIVSLDDLGQEQPLKFSPDDGMLATWCVDGKIRLWDLRRIRQELLAMKLDWDATSLPERADSTALRLELAR